MSIFSTAPNAKKTKAPASSRGKAVQDGGSGNKKPKRAARSTGSNKNDATPQRQAPSVSLDWFSASPSSPLHASARLEDAAAWSTLDTRVEAARGAMDNSGASAPVYDGLIVPAPRVLLTDVPTSRASGGTAIASSSRRLGTGFRAALPPSVLLIVEEVNRTISNAIQMAKSVLAKPIANMKDPEFGMCVFRSLEPWVVGHVSRRRRYFQSVSTNLAELRQQLKSDLDRICLTPLSTPARLRQVISHVETARKRLDFSIHETIHESFRSVYGAGKNVQLIFGPSGCGKNLAVRLLETVHLKPILPGEDTSPSELEPQQFLHTWHFDELPSLSLDDVLDSIESFFSSLWLMHSNSLQRIGAPRCGLLSNIDALFDGAIFDEDTAQPAIFQCLWRCIEQYAIKHPPQVRPILYITSSSSARCFLLRELGRKISSLNTDGFKMSVNYDFCESFYEKYASDWLLSMTKPGTPVLPCLANQFPNIKECVGRSSASGALKSACLRFASVVGAPQLKHTTMAKWLFAIDWLLISTPYAACDTITQSPTGDAVTGASSNFLQYSFFHAVQLCLQPSARSKLCDTAFFWDMMSAHHDDLHNLPRLFFDFATHDAKLDATLLSDARESTHLLEAGKEGSAFDPGHPFLTNTFEIQCLADAFARHDYSREMSRQFVSSALEILVRCGPPTNPFTTLSAASLSDRVYKALNGFKSLANRNENLPNAPMLKFAPSNNAKLRAWSGALNRNSDNTDASSSHSEAIAEALNRIVR